MILPQWLLCGCCGASLLPGKVTLVIMGLDNAGKTTLLNALRGQVEEGVRPTVGFSNATIPLDGGKRKLNVFDLGGGKNIRRIWSTYLADVHGAVYVVDAADAPRLDESREVLASLLADPHLRGKPLLVLANKQDLPGAAKAHEIASALGLSPGSTPELGSFNIQPCSAGEATAAVAAGMPLAPGLQESLGWLVAAVDRDYSHLEQRVQQEGAAVRLTEEMRKKERQQRARQAQAERLRPEQAESSAGEFVGVSVAPTPTPHYSHTTITHPCAVPYAADSDPPTPSGAQTPSDHQAYSGLTSPAGRPTPLGGASCSDLQARSGPQWPTERSASQRPLSALPKQSLEFLQQGAGRAAAAGPLPGLEPLTGTAAAGWSEVRPKTAPAAGPGAGLVGAGAGLGVEPWAGAAAPAAAAGVAVAATATAEGAGQDEEAAADAAIQFSGVRASHADSAASSLGTAQVAEADKG